MGLSALPRSLNSQPPLDPTANSFHSIIHFTSVDLLHSVFTFIPREEEIEERQTLETAGRASIALSQL